MHEQNYLPGGTGKGNGITMGKRVQFLARNRKWMCYIKLGGIWTLTQAEYRRKRSTDGRVSRREWEAEINKRSGKERHLFSAEVQMTQWTCSWSKQEKKKGDQFFQWTEKRSDSAWSRDLEAWGPFKTNCTSGRVSPTAQGVFPSHLSICLFP